MKPGPSAERREEMRSALVLPLLLALALAATACLSWRGLKPPAAAAPQEDAVTKSDEEWRKALTPMQYHVLREKGTERAFTGEYTDTETVGVYCCAGCGAELFVSDAKFHSGCGWPSFFQPLDDAKITKTEDTSHGMVRTEVCCKRCGGHLGHVFDDGPPPTFLRFCINSASLRLVPR